MCKELYKRGIFANIIDWNYNFSPEERFSLSSLYDVFVTVPGNSVRFLNEHFGVTDDRIIAVAHGRYDLEHGLNQRNRYSQFRRFAGVSPDLASYAKDLGISREMMVVRNGIHFDYFYQQPSSELRVLGYGGAFKHHDFGQTHDIKRGCLAQRVADTLGLPFMPASAQTFMTMPRYYNKIDAILVTSSQESCSLPLMESAASGRLPVSTLVGVARDFPSFPGVLLPMGDGELVQEAVDKLSQLKADQTLFSKKCKEAQEFARLNYDWEHVIEDWVSLLS